MYLVLNRRGTAARAPSLFAPDSSIVASGSHAKDSIVVVFCSLLGEAPVTAGVALSPNYLPSPSSRRLLTEHLSGVRSEVDRIPNRGFKALPGFSIDHNRGMRDHFTCGFHMKSIEMQRRTGRD